MIKDGQGNTRWLLKSYIKGLSLVFLPPACYSRGKPWTNVQVSRKDTAIHGRRIHLPELLKMRQVLIAFGSMLALEYNLVMSTSQVASFPIMGHIVISTFFCTIWKPLAFFKKNFFFYLTQLFQGATSLWSVIV